MVLGNYPYIWLVVLFIVVFFVMRIGVGIWASRKVTNTADYVVAGRSLPGLHGGCLDYDDLVCGGNIDGGIIDRISVRLPGSSV